MSALGLVFHYVCGLSRSYDLASLDLTVVYRKKNSPSMIYIELVNSGKRMSLARLDIDCTGAVTILDSETVEVQFYAHIIFFSPRSHAPVRASKKISFNGSGDTVNLRMRAYPAFTTAPLTTTGRYAQQRKEMPVYHHWHRSMLIVTPYPDLPTFLVDTWNGYLGHPMIPSGEMRAGAQFVVEMTMKMYNAVEPAISYPPGGSATFAESKAIIARVMETPFVNPARSLCVNKQYMSTSEDHACHVIDHWVVFGIITILLSNLGLPPTRLPLCFSFVRGSFASVG
ncbi:hypothetical protein EDD18DRAFT_1115631 [Armillaria luteobubalina]|uniref:Uncharacterized protein n=1 Tax=Armillaria luteobubalina TaxID=153913 RepID=A0AA39P2R7_9AGAR|nr:hypothetical protein EDD18DRAFT_1115631 [Armillaria luteobubalina]